MFDVKPYNNSPICKWKAADQALRMLNSIAKQFKWMCYTLNDLNYSQYENMCQNVMMYKLTKSTQLCCKHNLIK